MCMVWYGVCVPVELLVWALVGLSPLPCILSNQTEEA